MMSLVLVVFALICGSSVAQASTKCIQGENCHLPDCFCPTFRHPLFGDIKDIPQMVYFGFDDALHSQVDRFYRQLFTKDRRNPNGCPITMSLYVQDHWTSYAMVNSYYRRGMEVGSHSVTHTNVDTASKLLFEAGRQKDNLTRVGHVPSQQIVGWRSPNLKTAGDAQPGVLKRLGYTYDISLTYTRHRTQDPIPWPYTLDFGYPYSCSVRPCPGVSSPHPGFWEVPVPSLYDPQSGYPCAYVDSCRPSDEEAAVEYLWSNFEQVYKNNRAPFGLNMHGAWFFTPAYMRAMQTFIQRLLQLPDVYILTARHVLDWMRNPVKVSEISKLTEWGCGQATPTHSSGIFRTPQHPLSGLRHNNTGPSTPAAPHQTQGTRRPPTITRLPMPATYAPHIRTYQPPRTTYRPPNRTYRPPNRTHQPSISTYQPSGITYQPPERTHQPPNRTYQPPNRTYQPPNRTYQPPNRTYQPPNRTYQPSTSTYRPPKRTYQPPRTMYQTPGRTYQSSHRTYQPPNRTYQPPNRTYQPPNRTYQPPNRTYQPPNRTYQPPNRTYQPLNQTYRPPNSIFHFPLSFIPVPSRPESQETSNPNHPNSAGSDQHTTASNTGTQEAGTNVRPQSSGIGGHVGSPSQPGPVLIKLDYHPISPPRKSDNISPSNGSQDARQPEKTGPAFLRGHADDVCLQGITCSLPSCTCRSFDPPAKLSVGNTPQIVYLTFTGTVNGLNYQRVLNLLTSRRNPNNCPISATFFVPLTGNYVPYVQSLRSRGNEIAMYGSDPYMFSVSVPLKQQMQKELENFKSHDRKAGIGPRAGSVNRGYRSPDGSNLGKGLMEGLHAGKVVYDASLVTSRRAALHDVIPWPYTLDYGWKDCRPGSVQCPSGRYPGLWEIPFIPLVDRKQNTTCAFADGCHTRPTDNAQDIAQFFTENLHHALSTNRAPLGLHLRSEWFSDPLFYPNLQGLQLFLDTILESRDDVFVTSVEKMVDWMKGPVGLDRLGTSEAWKC
ncbi:uncharacterized protein LOC143282330 [Babylonia areolata]|uniref:uncharacterized protein LOC143282330 n=1 Tax=Babylonia areolata TaxID=304850 RepID=UPI003FD09CD8